MNAASTFSAKAAFLFEALANRTQSSKCHGLSLSRLDCAVRALGGSSLKTLGTWPLGTRTAHLGRICSRVVSHRKSRTHNVFARRGFSTDAAVRMSFIATVRHRRGPGGPSSGARMPNAAGHRLEQGNTLTNASHAPCRPLFSTLDKAGIRTLGLPPPTSRRRRTSPPTALHCS